MNTKYWSPCALPLLRYKGYFPLVTKGFCLFILFMGFSTQECWSGLSFPSPVDHILPELSTMTCPFGVALHSTAHCFIELDRAVVHGNSLINFFCDCGFHSVCSLMDKDKKLMETSWWERLTEGETGSSPTLCDPMDCSTPGLPVHHQHPEFTQTHVHWDTDAIHPSHPMSSPSPPTFNLSQYQVLFKWISPSHQVAKVLEFQLQHQSFQWIFRISFL